MDGDMNATRRVYTAEELAAIRETAAELGVRPPEPIPTPYGAEQAAKAKAEAEIEADRYARRDRAERAWRTAREIVVLAMEPTIHEVRRTLPGVVPWPNYEPSIAALVKQYNELFSASIGHATIVVWPALDTPAGRVQPVGAMVAGEIVAAALERSKE